MTFYVFWASVVFIFLNPTLGWLIQEWGSSWQMLIAILADSQADSLCFLCRLIALFCNFSMNWSWRIRSLDFYFLALYQSTTKRPLTSGPSFSTPHSPGEPRQGYRAGSICNRHLWAQCLALLNKPKAVINTPRGKCEGQQGPKGCGSQFHSVTPEVQMKRLSKWLGRKLEIKGMRSPQQLSFACEMF